MKPHALALRAHDSVGLERVVHGLVEGLAEKSSRRALGIGGIHDDDIIAEACQYKGKIRLWWY
jgi:hypothetical protein